MINETGLDYLRKVKYGFQDEQKPNSNKGTTENFNEKDKQVVMSHIQDILNRFDRLDAGQQVIFEELEGLRAHLDTLNKKDWTQLLKGKLLDLGAKKVVDFAVMNVMYETITQNIRAGQFVLPQ